VISKPDMAEWASALFGAPASGFQWLPMPAQLGLDDFRNWFETFLDALSLSSVSDWFRSLDTVSAALIGIAALVVLLFATARLPRRTEKDWQLAEQKSMMPALPVPKRAASEAEWVPDIAARLGIEATDRGGLERGIENLRQDIRRLFAETDLRAAGPTMPPAPSPSPAPSVTTLWRRLLDCDGADDVKALLKSRELAEVTSQALAIALTARILDERGRDEGVAALDGYLENSLAAAVDWWRSVFAVARAGDREAADLLRDESGRTMARIIMRAEVVATTYLNADESATALALSSIAGAVRQTCGRIGWSFDRPRLMAWQPPASSDGIERVFIARPNRRNHPGGAVAPDSRFYLKAVRSAARELPPATPVAVDIVLVGFRGPDGRSEPTRLVSYNPAEWI